MINDWTQSIINQAKKLNVEHAQEFVDKILEDETHSLYKGITVHPEPKDFYSIFVKIYRHWEKTDEIDLVEDKEGQFYQDIRDNRIDAVRNAAEILGHFIIIKGNKMGSYDRVMAEYDGDLDAIVDGLETHKETQNQKEIDKRNKQIQRDREREEAARRLVERQKYIDDVIKDFQVRILGEPLGVAFNEALKSQTPNGYDLFTNDDKQRINTKRSTIENTYKKEIEKVEAKRIDRYSRLLKTRKTPVSRSGRPITHVNLVLPDVTFDADVSAYTEMYAHVVTWLVKYEQEIHTLLELKGNEYPFASENVDDLSDTTRKNGSIKHLEFNGVIYAIDTHGSTDRLEKKAKKVVEAYGFKSSRLTIT